MKTLAGWLLGVIVVIAGLSFATHALRDFAYANAPPLTPETYVGDIPLPTNLAAGYSRATRAYVGNILYLTLTLRYPPAPDAPAPVDSMRALACTTPVVQGDAVVVGINAPDGSPVSQVDVRPQDCQ